MSIRLPFLGRRSWGAPCLVAVLLAIPGGAEAGMTWLPGPSPLGRSSSDPRQPRFALAFLPDQDRVDASLGSAFPLARVDAGPAAITASLEGAAYLTLGRDGSKFPLRTVDGLFGLSLDAAKGAWGARLRLVHVSAHLADGDSAVAYPGITYSKETANLDLTWSRGSLFVYGGAGGAWHAVPRDRGIHLAAGGEWRGARGAWRPLVSVHLEGDRERSFRLSKSAFLGAETGRGLTVRMGLRGFDGLSPRGQAWLTPERYVGIELQLTPQSPQLLP